jgi:ribosomal protein S24E
VIVDVLSVLMRFHLFAHYQVVDVIHPGRANVSKTELQEKVGQVRKNS